MNDFYRHKKGDKIKWIITGIAFVLVFVMIAGICMQLFGTGKVKPSEWFKKTECVHIDEDSDGKCDECGKDIPAEVEDKTGGNELSGGIVIPHESVTKTMRLTAMPLSADDNLTAPDVATYADNSYTLTATITPASADNKAVDWSVTWKNPSSSWASGKSIANYVTVTPTSNGSLTARVECKQAFGEQAIVTVTSRQNTEIKATATVDYKEKFVSAPYSIQIGGSNYTVNNSTALPLSSTNGTGSVNVNKSVGTISTNYTATAQIKLANGFIDYLSSQNMSGVFINYDNWRNAVGAINLLSCFEDALYELMSDDIVGAGLDYEIFSMVYDVMRGYTGTVFEVSVTVKEGSATVSNVTYTAPLDRTTITVPVGSLSLNMRSIVF